MLALMHLTALCVAVQPPAAPFASRALPSAPIRRRALLTYAASTAVLAAAAPASALEIRFQRAGNDLQWAELKAGGGAASGGGRAR